MKKTQVTLPQIMTLAGTRVALGAGLGLLLSDTLDCRKRKAIGWGLFMLGTASTVPLVRSIFGTRPTAADDSREG